MATSPEKTPDMKFEKNLTLFRCSAFRFHDDRFYDTGNFSISLTAYARKLLDSSNDSKTSSFYLTYRGTIWLLRLVFELLR